MSKCPYAAKIQGEEISRRGFLSRALGLGAAAVAAIVGGGPLGRLAAHAAAVAPWVALPFEGETWDPCHDLRDGVKFPTSTGRGEEVDVLIVGGGISGLLTAHMLGKNVNYLILEKDSRPGGNSRRALWDGVYYPLGALYIAEPVGATLDLFKELKLEAKAIPTPVDSLLVGGKVYPDFFGHGVHDLPLQKSTRKALAEAWKHFSALLESPDLPMIPVQDSTKKAMLLDGITMGEYCRRRKFEKYVTDLIDMYVRSCWGVGNDKVSAYAAINFLCSEFESVYAFPGGNGAISDALAHRLEKRIRTRAFAFRMQEETGGVRVDYTWNGEPARVKARHVVAATPKHITLRMMPGLPDGLVRALGSVRYGAYLAGEIFLNAPLVKEGAFDLWTEGRWYTDLCLADWVATRGKPRAARKTIMTASIPMGEQEGRAELLTATHEELSRRLMDDLVKDFPDAREKVAGMQFARYGHPMVLPYPGFISTVTPLLRRPWGRFWFCHTDSQGMPCFEGAFSEATRVSRAVRKALAGERAYSTV
ncbi:MAG: FAD-dependent oxidoreductase [Armatimonadetes bacterium]|nr:FAD-dependent oxidoreductase [Armatimonadota bacterium]